MRQRFEVVVVGGGPVGLALATALSQRGVSCALVERRLEPQPIPKGQNLTQRTLEHFYAFGCVEQLRARGVLPTGYPIGGVVAYGDLTSPYWHAPAGREAVGAYFFQQNERLPQYETEAVLRETVASLEAVKALYGFSVTDVDQDAEEVRVTAVADEPGGEGFVLEAEYVVGCDGARSLVREQMGIDRVGDDFDQKMVLAVFRSTELHERLERFPERTTYRALHPDMGGYWRFFGRIDVGEGWFFHAPVPRDATEESLDVHRLLEEAAGFTFEATIDHVGFWELRIEVASTYRNRRAFIAGDACHSHPPYYGYGLNAGLEDAVNLGWKLAGVLQGWGGEHLLDSYSEERRPIFEETGREVIATGIENVRRFLERYRPEVDRDEFEEAWAREMAVADTGPQWYEPNYEGSSVVAGPPGARCTVHGEHRFAARPGHHLAPCPLSRGRDVYEELGEGFSLLALGAKDEDVARFVEAAASRGVPLTVIRDDDEDERARYEAHLVLVRPDQHVAWCASGAPDDPGALLLKVTGRT